MSPTTDEGAGSFGTPTDAYENFLLIGDETWTQVVAQTVVVSHDDDGVGLGVVDDSGVTPPRRASPPPSEAGDDAPLDMEI